MPLKGKSKVRRRRAPRRRRVARKRKSTAIITRSLGYCFPQRLRCSLPYVENSLTLTAAAVPYEYIFTGNNLFDPNLSGIGHQPLYYDTLAAIYGRYYVRASAIKVEVYSTAAGIYAGSGRALVLPHKLATPISGLINFTTMLEQEHNRYKPFTANGGSRDICRLRHRSTSRKELVAPGNTSYDASSDVTTGPLDQWYWHLIISSMDDSSPVTASLRVSIVYDIEFSERKVHQGS